MKQAENDASFRLFISYCAGIVPGKSLEVQRENFSLCSYVQGKIFPYIFLIGEFFFQHIQMYSSRCGKYPELSLKSGQWVSKTAGQRGGGSAREKFSLSFSVLLFNIQICGLLWKQVSRNLLSTISDVFYCQKMHSHKFG